MKILPSLKIGAAVLASAMLVAPVAMAQETTGGTGQGTAASSDSQTTTSSQDQTNNSNSNEKGSGATLKVGYLSCHEAAGWGHVLTKSTKINCIYSPVKGRPELYTGTITEVGLNVGYSSSAVMLWGVIAPSSNVPSGALAGNYGGVTAGASAVYGGSASAIIGGFKHSIQLEPLAITGEKGLNIAAGVEKLTLHYNGKASEQQASR
jgi:hypothetical protein